MAKPSMEEALEQVGVRAGNLISFHVIRTLLAVYVGPPGAKGYHRCVAVTMTSFEEFMAEQYRNETLVDKSEESGLFGARIDYEYIITAPPRGHSAQGVFLAQAA